MPIKIPSDGDFAAYDGAHCHILWKGLSAGWRCPGCNRTAKEIMRWTKRQQHGKPAYMGWMAGLHQHHDHAKDLAFCWDGRFKTVTICDQCNSADGTAKKKLKLPENFSFAPVEIQQFITATPHEPHRIDFEKAADIYKKLASNHSILPPAASNGNG